MTTCGLSRKTDNARNTSLFVYALKMFYQNVFQVVDVSSAVLVTASVLVVGYVCTCLRASRERTTLDLDSKPSRRVLLITAHPDDECMFFGPTVRKLTKTKDVRLYLMCLSVGNTLIILRPPPIPPSKNYHSVACHFR